MAFIIGKCQLFIPEMCIGVLTTFIQACSLHRKRKAHKITSLYPLEIPDLKPPDAFGIPIVSTPLAFGIPVQRTPPCLRNSKKPSVVLYGYFLELPIEHKNCRYKPLKLTGYRKSSQKINGIHPIIGPPR